MFSSRESSNNNKPYAPLVYSLILAFGVLLGYMVNSYTINKKQPFITHGYDKLDDILNYVSIKYVDTVNKQNLYDLAVDKMLSSLDPHSVYIPPRDMSQVTEQLEGNFEGIGIEFSIIQDTINVVSPISGGPSETLGVKSGDRIIKINDTIVASIKIKNEDVMRKLRGTKGSTVKVSIMREGHSKLLDFNIVRDKIPIYSIDAAYLLNPETGYIKVNRFSATTHEEFHQKLQSLLNSGMKKLVIDLRENPGGYLQAATIMADELLSGEKLIVYTQGRSFTKQEYHAGKPGLFEKGDLVVLIDQGSASASEILSGAVQDWDRGTIIGRTSFGKGLVQEQFDLRDGSALRLTVARYYTPSGRCIQKPYDHGTEEYNNELNERYLNGELTNADSLHLKDTTKYYTKIKHKIVYSAGGIRPDIFIPVDTSEASQYYFSLRVLVSEFSYKHYSANTKLFAAFTTVEDFRKSFNVDDNLYQKFIAYANEQGLKSDASKIAKYSSKLRNYIKAYIAKQIWRADGFWAVTNERDEMVNKALEVLK
jgi:carboxyl-terminal processing protease